MESLAKSKYDFTLRQDETKSHAGFLEKKGNSGQTWKRRYFYLNNGILKYFEKGPSDDFLMEGEKLKGQIVLRGAQFSLYKLSRIDITCAGDKVNAVSLRASTAPEATEWFNLLLAEVERVNINALNNGSQLPEIISWYNTLKQEVSNRAKVLEAEVAVEYTYADPFRKGAEKKTNIIFSVPREQHTLLIRVEDKGKPFDTVETALNNKSIPLTDILGAMTETSYSEGSNSTFFKMKLITTAETYPCQFIQQGGPVWLKHLQDLVSFTHILPPGRSKNNNNKLSNNTAMENITPFSKNNNSTSNTNYDNDVSTTADNDNNSVLFEAPSSSSFTVSRDVVEYIEQMQNPGSFIIRNTNTTNNGDESPSKTTKLNIPILSEVATLFTDILNTILDVKCNKPVAFRFGHRLEEIIRCLCMTDSGIIPKAINSSSSSSLSSSSFSAGYITLLQFHMSSFKTRLNDVLVFIRGQSIAGWLQFSMTIEGSAMFQYKELYNNIISIVNNMTTSILKQEPTLKPIYESLAVDVKKTVDSIGTFEKIAHNPLLVEELSESLEADLLHVQTELNLALVMQGKNPVAFSFPSSHKQDKHNDDDNGNNSRDIGSSNSGNNIGGGNKNKNKSCCASCFCCCFGRSKSKSRQNSSDNNNNNNNNNTNNTTTTSNYPPHHPNDIHNSTGSGTSVLSVDSDIQIKQKLVKNTAGNSTHMTGSVVTNPVAKMDRK